MEEVRTIEFFSPEERDAYVRNVLSKRRRELGSVKLTQMNNFMSKAEREATLAKKPVEVVLSDMIRANPEQVEKIANYVRTCGMVPHGDFNKLMMQAAHCMGGQMAEVQSFYDPENFDEVDCFFLDSPARKKARKEKKQAKFIRRAERRDKKHKVKMAKLDVKHKRHLKDAEQIDAEPIEQPEEVEDQTAEQVEDQTTEDNNEEFDGDDFDSFTEDLPVLHVDQFGELVNPSLQAAQTEVLGEMFEGPDSYEGESDNFLPFLAGAISVGSKLLSGKKVDQQEVRDLFRKKNKKVMPPDIPKGAKAADIINSGVKKMVQAVEQKKKSDFLKENWIYIAIAIAFIFYIGHSSKSA